MIKFVICILNLAKERCIGYMLGSEQFEVKFESG